MDETLSPSTLKDFEIIKQAGKGSYGTVFKVRKRSDQNIYAMKTINISSMDKKTLTNTLNELRILCSINHPNIVGYKEAFIEKDGKELCVIMEFVGGGDMSEKVAECKKKRMAISEDTIWKYTCQVLLGLRALHDMKIIHRDIKSANLFLSEDYETIKLGDLNVAKIAKNDLASTQIGTPYYLAPEIWQNKLYDYRCDIFSLGCVMYEMAALRVPFEAGSIQELYKRITKGVIERIPPRYSDELYTVIKLFLTKEPKNRPNVREALSMPVLAKKMEAHIGLDVIKDKAEVDRLMDTIIVPRNLSQLKNRLPKRLSRAQSCTSMKAEEDGAKQEQSKNEMDKLIARLRLNKENSEKKVEVQSSPKLDESKRAPPLKKMDSKMPPVKNTGKLPPMRPPVNTKNPSSQNEIAVKPKAPERPKAQIVHSNSKANLDTNKIGNESGVKNGGVIVKNRPRMTSADPTAKQNEKYDIKYRPVWWGN